MKRIFPTEDPKYGESFVIKGIQIQDIDGRFSDMFSIELSDKKTKEELIFKIGKNWQEWRRNKQKISDLLCTDMNPGLRIPWKDVVALEICYFFSTEKAIL